MSTQVKGDPSLFPARSWDVSRPVRTPVSRDTTTRGPPRRGGYWGGHYFDPSDVPFSVHPTHDGCSTSSPGSFERVPETAEVGQEGWNRPPDRTLSTRPGSVGRPGRWVTPRPLVLPRDGSRLSSQPRHGDGGLGPVSGSGRTPDRHGSVGFGSGCHSVSAFPRRR